MKTITISRQYGSGGREIAKMLSEEIGIPFYDSDLLAIASEKYGISPGLMAEYDERKSSSFCMELQCWRMESPVRRR